MTKAAGPYNATVWVKDVREAASEGMAALYLALIPPVAMAAAGAYCAYFAATNGQNNWAVAFAASAVLTMAFAVCSEGQRRAHGPAILLKMVTWGASSLRIGIFGADALLALLDPSLDPMGLSSRVAAGYDLWAKYLGLDCAPCLQAIDAAGLVELVVLLLRYPFRSQAKQERPSQYRVKPGEEGCPTSYSSSSSAGSSPTGRSGPLRDGAMTPSATSPGDLLGGLEPSTSPCLSF